MPLIDNQNKVIYWDEVNWKWLPYVKTNKDRYYYLRVNGKNYPVKCKEDTIKVLTSFGFSLSSLQELGVVEILGGSFLYNGKLYQAESSRISLVTLISFLSGKSKTWILTRLTGKGVLSKSLFSDFVSNPSKIDNMLKNKEYKIEYKGKFYVSTRSLSQDLGIPYNHMHKQLHRGMSIDDVVKGYKSRNIEDHLGNRFESTTEMLNHWGISANSFYGRLRKGWSLEKVLSTPMRKVKKDKKYKDFKGNLFTSISDMAREYGVSYSALQKFLNEGKTSEEATFLISQRVVKDHLGNIYPTIVKMAESYNVSVELLHNRLSTGWSVEEALTGKRIKE